MNCTRKGNNCYSNPFLPNIQPIKGRLILIRWMLSLQRLFKKVIIEIKETEFPFIAFQILCQYNIIKNILQQIFIICPTNIIYIHHCFDFCFFGLICKIYIMFIIFYKIFVELFIIIIYNYFITISLEVSCLPVLFIDFSYCFIFLWYPIIIQQYLI